MLIFIKHCSPTTTRLKCSLQTLAGAAAFLLKPGSTLRITNFFDRYRGTVWAAAVIQGVADPAIVKAARTCFTTSSTVEARGARSQKVHPCCLSHRHFFNDVVLRLFEADPTARTFCCGSSAELVEFSVKQHRAVFIDGPWANIFDCYDSHI